jgi:hypothetical protein
MTLFIHYVVLFCTFAVLWFFSLLCLLPVGFGSERDPDSGVPLSPMLAKKAAWATAIAMVLWVAFFTAVQLRIVDL